MRGEAIRFGAGSSRASGRIWGVEGPGPEAMNLPPGKGVPGGQGRGATVQVSAQLHSYGEDCRAAHLSPAVTCAPSALPPSLGLVLPPYGTFYLQANLSDQILQVKCKWPAPACALHPCLCPAPQLAPGSTASCLWPGSPSCPVCPPPGARRPGQQPGKSVEICMLASPWAWFQTALPFSHGFR